MGIDFNSGLQVLTTSFQCWTWLFYNNLVVKLQRGYESMRVWSAAIASGLSIHSLVSQGLRIFSCFAIFPSGVCSFVLKLALVLQIGQPNSTNFTVFS